MLTTIQKKTAEAIVNIFETGFVLGDYGNVTLIPGDPGHLTFGRSQTTLGSGNLFKLLRLYCESHTARFRVALKVFLPRFAKTDLTLDHEIYLHNILRASADDSTMREIQDLFFDQTYWQPAEEAANNLGIFTPLGVAVVYDSTVHGSFELICHKTNQAVGNLKSLGEQKWIEAYVRIRREWLATNPLPVLHATVYRMDAMQHLINLDLWNLELPLLVRGEEISSVTLGAFPPGCFRGPEPGSRPLELQTPLARGLDVRLVQLGLSQEGIDVKADGIFGKGSLVAVKNYQAANNLPVSGVMDTEMITQLMDRSQTAVQMV